MVSTSSGTRDARRDRTQSQACVIGPANKAHTVYATPSAHTSNSPVCVRRAQAFSTHSGHSHIRILKNWTAEALLRAGHACRPRTRVRGTPRTRRQHNTRPLQRGPASQAAYNTSWLAPRCSGWPSLHHSATVPSRAAGTEQQLQTHAPLQGGRRRWQRQPCKHQKTVSAVPGCMPTLPRV